MVGSCGDETFYSVVARIPMSTHQLPTKFVEANILFIGVLIAQSVSQVLMAASMKTTRDKNTEYDNSQYT